MRIGYPKFDFDLKPIKPTLTFKTIENNCEEGPFEILKKIRINNVKRVVIGHINIKFIRNKFDMVKGNNDILMISETKLDSSFPQAQFRMERYAPLFRYDRNYHGGGILLFLREDIPTKIISITPLKEFEGIFVKLKFRKKKFYLVPINLIKILSQIIREDENSLGFYVANSEENLILGVSTAETIRERL